MKFVPPSERQLKLQKEARERIGITTGKWFDEFKKRYTKRMNTELDKGENPWYYCDACEYDDCNGCGGY